MVISFVGSGGKTTAIHEYAAKYREQKKRVFVTTTTHMMIETDTIMEDDPEYLISILEEKGYLMAGKQKGEKIGPLSYETYLKICEHADVVLVEADGSKRLPLKYPDDHEPVIYDNTTEIVVVTGLNAIGHPVKEVCHRIPLVNQCLNTTDDTIIEAVHIQKLLEEGYLHPLSEKYPGIKLTVRPTHVDNLYDRVVASMLMNREDVSCIDKEWFEEKPDLFICGAGHVAYEVATMAEHLDFQITVMDDREEFANHERYSDKIHVICDTFDHLEKHLKKNAFYIVVSRGHKDDYVCVEKILGSSYQYLGMIGSKKKVKKTFDRLEEAGFTKEQIGSVHAPIGLKIGAVTPGEIAVSILAEIIQNKNTHHVSSVSQELLHTKKSGMLCIVIDKKGSAPRGIGSMMLVCEDEIIDTIGGGQVEFEAFTEAKLHPYFHMKDYLLDNEKSRELGMICGGSQQIIFIPLT